MVEGAAALPPVSESGIYWTLDVAIWILSEWAYAAGLMALLGAAYSLYKAPSRPVAAAVWKIVGDLLPPLILIFLVLGTIFQGIATPTEGGAMGAVGALVLALARRRLDFSLLRQALESTTKLSAFVVFILVGARVFSLTFYGVDGHKWVENLLISLPGGEIGFLVVVNAVVFVLAFFLDFFELAFIIVPLLAGPAEALGIDLIWFGVLLGINMQTSFMHPPFGFALFYLRSVAPRERYRDRQTGRTIEPVTTGQIYWGSVPFVIIQVIMVGLARERVRQIIYQFGRRVQRATRKTRFKIIGGMHDAREADFKRAIVRQLLNEGGFARRIEDKFAVGSLDMLLITPLNTIYAEAKLLKGIAALPASVAQRHQIGLVNRDRQPDEPRARHRPQGRHDVLRPAGRTLRRTLPNALAARRAATADGPPRSCRRGGLQQSRGAGMND